MHPIPMQFIKNANREDGGSFFDQPRCTVASETAFFNRETQSAYFVTSELFAQRGARHFRVYEFTPEGRIRLADDSLFTGFAAAERKALDLAC